MLRYQKLSGHGVCANLFGWQVVISLNFFCQFKIYSDQFISVQYMIDFMK